jgi:prepilin-type N-terminal cleavage/methylation domain-containing protein
MKEKSFTLIELLITVLIFSILVSISVVAYAKTVERARERTCIENQLLIKTLLDNYIIENNIAPAALAAVPEEYFIKALAKLEQQDPSFMDKRRLYARIIHPLAPSIAYAAYTENDYLAKASGIKVEFLICPMDKNFKKPDNTAIPYTGVYSYAMNNELNNAITSSTWGENMTQRWQYALDNNKLISVDSQFPYFNDGSPDFQARHTHIFGTDIALGITGQGDTQKLN